jgi:hypothetical protein
MREKLVDYTFKANMINKNLNQSSNEKLKIKNNLSLEINQINMNNIKHHQIK